MKHITVTVHRGFSIYNNNVDKEKIIKVFSIKINNKKGEKRK